MLRPTWHFVLPADIRWLLALTAPRVRAAMAYYDRKLALDDGVFRRSQTVLARALAGGKALTREELARALAAAGIEASGQRLGHIMMRAELDALIVQRAAARQAVHLRAARRARAARPHARRATRRWPSWPGATSPATARRCRRTSPGGPG